MIALFSFFPLSLFFFLLQLLLFICVWLLGSKAFRFYASHSLLLSYSFSPTYTLLRHSLCTPRLELLSDDVDDDDDDDDAGRSCASMTIFWSNAAHTYTKCEHMHVSVYGVNSVCVYMYVCVVLVPIFTQCLCKLQQYLQILSARAHKNDAAGAARGRVYTHT